MTESTGKGWEKKCMKSMYKWIISDEIIFLKLQKYLNGFGIFDRSKVLQIGAYSSHYGVKVSR
jgi:hypothetical protein